MTVQQNITALSNEKPHVLVVDDDARLRELLKRYLSKNDFIVVTAFDANDALEKLQVLAFDIAIVDVMMPNEDGISLAKKIRKSYPNLAITLLTALGEVENRIQGLEAGVDDYISKPFEPQELMLRLQAVLRRTMVADKQKEQSIILLGQYSYDCNREELKGIKNNEYIALTETEKHLLTFLAHRAEQVVSREELSKIGSIGTSDRAIDVQITRLRRKIEIDSKNPRYLHTVRGQGYVLRPDVDF